MFIFSKKGWGGFAALALLISFFSFQSFTTPMDDCNCQQASNLTASQQTDSAINLSWNATNGATSYEVWYVRNDGLTGNKILTSATSADFNGLTPGSYDFFVVTVCGTDVAEFVIMEDIIIE